MGIGILSGIGFRLWDTGEFYREGIDLLTNDFTINIFYTSNLFMLGYMADFYVFKREFYNIWILGTVGYGI
jgi:hypothetical protein